MVNLILQYLYKHFNPSNNDNREIFRKRRIYIYLGVTFRNVYSKDFMSAKYSENECKERNNFISRNFAK